MISIMHMHTYSSYPQKGSHSPLLPTVPNIATTFPSGWLWAAFAGGTP